MLRLAANFGIERLPGGDPVLFRVGGTKTSPPSISDRNGKSPHRCPIAAYILSRS
jgi:hypothetical protein